MNKRNIGLGLSSFELACIGLLTIGIILAGNIRFFLGKIGLIDSSSVVQSQLSHHVGSGLQTFDSFKATPAIVTFVTWGIIGLITFSIVQAFVRASNTLKFERDLSSNRYVHPANFSRDRYWKRVAIDTLLSFALLVLLAVGVSLAVIAVLPVSFDNIDRFILQPGLNHGTDLLLGIFTVFVGTLAVYYLLKLVAWHHRLSQL